MIFAFVAFLAFYGLYFYYSYQVILLNDLKEIFSQTAIKAQEDFKGYGELVLEDLGKCYPHVLTIILAATVVTFLWILLLKYNANLIIWLSIFCLPVIISIGLYFSITTYVGLHMANNSDQLSNNLTDFVESDQYSGGPLASDPQSLPFDKALQTILTAELMSYVHNETLWLVISLVLFFVLFALFLILITLRERVRLSIALIKQASKAINGVKSTLIFPIIPRTFGIVALVYGVVIALLIISASQPIYRYEGDLDKPCDVKLYRATRAPNSTTELLSSANKQTDRTLQSVAPVPSTLPTGSTTSTQTRCLRIFKLSRQHVWKYHAVNVFAILWLLHFISGISQTTLAGAFASYYWAYRKPQDVPFFAVTASLFRVLRNHLGDIAFGSFLIATIRYIRIVIEFIDKRIRKNKSQDNSAAQSATCFCRVFFWLLDRFLKYIDRNAYIMMSMYGEGYLQSAKRAVELLYKNTTRAIVLDYVTYFVLLVSRLLITGLAGYVTALEMFTANLNYKWLPVALVVIGTYFVSKGLFSVYSMAVDTLFICFLIDSTNNDGSPERPYFMSKDLRRIMKKGIVSPTSPSPINGHLVRAVTSAKY